MKIRENEKIDVKYLSHKEYVSELVFEDFYDPNTIVGYWFYIQLCFVGGWSLIKIAELVASLDY